MNSHLNQRAGHLVLVSTLVLAMAAACTDRGEQAGRSGRVDGKPQVIEENYTRESQALGRPAEQQGKEEIRGSREIVERRTERVRESIPTVVTGQEMADINRMEEEDFHALGLAESIAEKIVDFRDKQPDDRFTSVDQLKQVPGMDLNWLSQQQGKLGVSNESAGKAGKN